MFLDTLPHHTYADACNRLLENGFLLLATGDWATVYQSPDGTQAVRLTPFDPAYRVWAEMCRRYPHPNLPRYDTLLPLDSCGHVASMPCYRPGDLSDNARFLADVKARLEQNPDDSLTQILQHGLRDGFAHVPYFAGLDDNPHNVLRDGDTPILVDGFFQRGALLHQAITEATASDAPLPVSLTERDAFLQIPFFARQEA